VADALRNFAYSLVATAPSPATSGTSLVVTAGQGALFPTPPFSATIWATAVNPLTTNAEIVRVTAISTDTLTIVRAQEGSAARTVVVGDQIAATLTAQFVGLGLVNRRPSYDLKVPAGHSAYVAKQFEVPAGITVEIDADGVLEIG
jgi:hypothetical protein